ncbi:MAG: CU044_2847 family protein [Methylococcaceae bacterium]
MATKLIELADGTLIEVEVPEDQAQQIAGGFADKVSSTLEKVKPMLSTISRSIMSTWHEIEAEAEIEQVEVELGLSFEGEGNVYVTKAKAGANFTIKLVLKPKR